MILWLGKNVSSRMHPEIPGGRSASFGEKYVSYPQLFSVLEVELGLVHTPVSTAKRISAYRKKLEAALTPQRFYHSSFVLDPIGVAKTLLGWRDELCLAGGGDLSLLAGAKSQRLRDLVQVEMAPGDLPAGEAERIDRIATALKSAATSVRKIVLLDAQAVLPESYRRLLSQLQTSGVELEAFKSDPAQASGNLEVLKQALASDNVSANKLKALDESLVVIETESDATAAEMLCRYLQSSQALGRLIIDEHQSQLLDAIGSENGLAKQGFGEISNLRPVLQILPVFISLFWKPLNVYRLLDFLLMPVSPIPKGIRYKLADAVSDQPGIGGRKWSEVIAEASEAEEQRVNEYLLIQRYGEDEGVPTRYLKEKLELLAQWARGYGQADQENAASTQLLILAGQISELIDLVSDLAKQTITRLELEQFLGLAAAAGIASSETTAEAAKPDLVTDPASVLAEVDELIWFDFTGEELWNSPRSHWFEDEKKEIGEKGLTLIDEGLVAKAKAEAAIRAVGFCKKKLILLRPFKKAGNETTHHPLHELALGRLGKLDAISVSERAVFSEGGAIIQGSEMHPVKRRVLPRPRRFWNIGATAGLDKERTESYSSLSNLFYYPHIYVLQNSANIRSSSLATVSGGAQLLGTIAHELLQRFLKDEIKVTALDNNSVRVAIAAEVEKLIEKEAAVFLLPGQGSSLENLLYSVTRSAIELKTLLNSNGYNKFETEKEIIKDFSGGKLKGYIDLIASGPGKQPIVIDLKWGGLKNRQEELEANDTLQLLIYSYLLKDKAWPEYAYFIISRARMLPAKDTFTGIAGLLPTNAETEQEIWEKVEATFAFRKEQLKQGIIEVPLGKLNEAEALAENEALLPMPAEANYYDEYGTLTGAGIS